MNRRVVIWGDDHHNALGLLRMLGGHGIEIFFLIHRINHHIATESKYCQNFAVVQSVEEGLEYLCSNYQDKENKAVLLFTADVYAETANNNLNRLKDCFFVAGVPIEKELNKINDKYFMGSLASKCGIKIPSTFLFPQDDLSNIRDFPVIIKPCSPCRKDFKTRIIYSEKELRNFQHVLIQGKRYVIQQFISKKADGLIYGCRTQQGATYLSGICVRNRWSDDGCGSFGYISSNIPESINREGIDKFLSEINFTGVFSVEYALTDNEAYFYEFNLRNDGTSVLFYQSGSNLALCYVNSCYGIDTNAPIKSEGTHFLINEIWDQYNVKDGLVSKKQWEDDFAKSSIYFYYDKDDMGPYNYQRSISRKRDLRRMISKSMVNKIRLKIKRYFKNKR